VPHEGGLFALTEEARQHWLKVFALIFGREAFLPTPSDSRDLPSAGVG
jgi:hypothetical protein